ncbi:hypothetical protein BLNAU_22785 [Blattamonas nauphoetae]|uniref:Uncharacterized protein n=1 Tax=Blattamonas nauphoetae TaxID=2049346 RepID=A0ABQ9WT63_9EUKA|nr:hypothetical protein BLNAU_22785 [Blattamonas nauphoetae]
MSEGVQDGARFEDKHGVLPPDTIRRAVSLHAFISSATSIPYSSSLSPPHPADPLSALDAVIAGMGPTGLAMTKYAMRSR